MATLGDSLGAVIGGATSLAQDPVGGIETSAQLFPTVSDEMLSSIRANETEGGSGAEGTQTRDGQDSEIGMLAVAAVLITAALAWLLK